MKVAEDYYMAYRRIISEWCTDCTFHYQICLTLFKDYYCPSVMEQFRQIDGGMW